MKKSTLHHMFRYPGACFSILFSLFLVLLPIDLWPYYWQQDVVYKMDIRLDTQAKTLDAISELRYINNSPDTLTRVMMHLYHNAFNPGTIAAQVYADYGYMTIIEKPWTGITIRSARKDSIDLQYEIRDDTILEIRLDQPLLPGDTLDFTLDWHHQIHEHLDRSGWQDDQFDFSQWYPKFVVYDQNGWHDDPFGDWGEFYGEFATFEVTLDIPQSHILGATGVVLKGDPGWSDVQVDTSVAWDKWLENFRSERDTLLAQLDTTDRRIVTFLAEHVHDFAWTCSPDFVYEHGRWEDVDINVLFTTAVGQSWTRNVVKHGTSAIQWLSTQFGPYPWPQMTITKALLGGGMEYPMLIMDATDSESLVVHEIGHNWFYGLFANDELDEAWLDEGLTTFQTTWYLSYNYPDNDYELSRNNITQFEYDHLPRQDYIEYDLKSIFSYMASPRNEPIATRSQDFHHQGSYRTNVYTKASLMFYSLKQYLGEERFLAGMRLYYDRWALKHVNEERFIKAMEDGSGEELDWFFDQWLHNTGWLDYGLDNWEVTRVGNEYETIVQVKRYGYMFAPIPVVVYGPEGQTSSKDLKEFRYRMAGNVEFRTPFKPVRVVLDPEDIFLDMDRRNNDSKKVREWRYDFRDWEEYPRDKNLYLYKPLIGYNDSDGLKVGISIRNVYRLPGNYWGMQTFLNMEEKNIDFLVDFKQLVIGYPFYADISGGIESWRKLFHVHLNYEMNLAKQYWNNPLHYITFSLDYTDPREEIEGFSSSNSYSRFSLKYEMQNKLFDGNLGLTGSLSYSPSGLGSWGNEFGQFKFLGNWQKNISAFNINYRGIMAAVYGVAPEEIKPRPATMDRHSSYRDILASTLHNTSSIDLIGQHYYLRGGGGLRAYTDALNEPVNFLWTNNIDLAFKIRQPGVQQLQLRTFFDYGQISDNGERWDWMADTGIGFEIKFIRKRTNWITTLMRPMRFRVEAPLARYEEEDWGFINPGDLWLFTVTWH